MSSTNGRCMRHLSEVVHILRAALDGNPGKARDYAELLASKLAEDGEDRQVGILRSVLDDIPQPMVFTSAPVLSEGEDNHA